MKHLFFTFFFLFIVGGYSQNEYKNVQVNYKLYYDTEMPRIINAVLYASKDKAIYQTLYSTYKTWDEKEKLREEKRKKENENQNNSLSITRTRLSKSNPEDDPYIIVDNAAKEMFFYDNILYNRFLVQDIYHRFKWNITGETKDIAGFLCTKATTNYRGRVWTAWFAPDIPIPFGPWKLHGLPGLILESTREHQHLYHKSRKNQLRKIDYFK
ncbi:hypothetical protein CHU92_03595 [Flavobacterium cyanobacteriorum]|uniref:GLPGLI family protein n=1 Tax=Flavobacterium cyanobacteriorum TaxID=2022802 RepID=A0A255ZPB0_9FLAO|nr:GLPGLI family protein [Flavobacterium cyanobacteriorum]OYQ43251.1 hypothetical protein CHU92_03595 [Flavobacterium cyanobacteriorum]